MGRRRPLRSALEDPAERFVELRIVHRQNGPAAELPHKAAEPNPAQPDRQGEVEPAQGDAVAMKFRRDQPEEIDEAGDEDPSGDHDERFGLALHGAREEQRLPAEPRLQTSPRQDLIDFHTQEDVVLNNYGWVDKNAGTVRIPIDEAMRITVRRGLPTRAEDRK